MKQLVILSGKGGTGKTSVTGAFAHLASVDGVQVKVALADADVDAANLELLLGPRIIEKHDFWGGKLAVIDQAICAGCGTCEAVCRFDAVYESEGIFRVDAFACDGCAACVYQCPEGAIGMQDQIAGEWYRSESRFGPLFHAALTPGGENSGKLVTLVKQHARLLALDVGYDLVLVDGPPGIGCPVISAVSGADLALIVTEPTAAGVHDMQRVLKTTEHFGVRALVCINKADIYPPGTQEVKRFCQEREIQVVGEIPFDLKVTDGMVQGQAITAFDTGAPASQAIRNIWHAVSGILAENEQ
jgi:MinD superfamily P-loop ATPase